MRRLKENERGRGRNKKELEVRIETPSTCIKPCPRNSLVEGLGGRRTMCQKCAVEGSSELSKEMETKKEGATWRRAFRDLERRKEKGARVCWEATSKKAWLIAQIERRGKQRLPARLKGREGRPCDNSCKVAML